MIIESLRACLGVGVEGQLFEVETQLGNFFISPAGSLPHMGKS